MSNFEKNCKPDQHKNTCKFPKLYLTFDDGPNGGTKDVLDALHNKGVKAAFFMNSIHLKNQPSLYTLVRRMIDEGHVLGDHGHDHNPESVAQYRKANPKDVEGDFVTSKQTFNEAFKNNKDSFPGFTAARLPGDGRTFKSYKAIITDKIKLPHVGWGAEFTTSGRFLKREKKNLLKISDKDSETEKKRKKEENDKIEEWNADPHHDFYTNWIPGVSATVRPGEWPKADDIVLLHDAPWAGKRSLLEKVIEKLQEKRIIVPLKPLPTPHPVITPISATPQNKVPADQQKKVPADQEHKSPG